MSETRDPGQAISWRTTTGPGDVITFCFAGICVLSAAGLGPRIISVVGLIILLLFPTILIAVYFWFPEAVDRLTDALHNVGRITNDRIQQILNTIARR